MTPLRDGIHGDLCAILAGVPGRFAVHSTIVIDGAPYEAYSGQSNAARRAGWAHAEIGPWTLFHRADGVTVAVGFRESMHPVHHLGVLFTRDTDPGTLALVLDRYAQCTGYAWRGTFATTGLNALRLTWENAPEQPRWRHPKVERVDGAGRLEWSRPLSEREQSWGWVHTFDANRAYLGAAINAEVAWSTLERTGARTFDPTRPGYWRVQLGPELLDMLDDPNRPPVLTDVQDGSAWVTTPYARFLGELGDPLWVIDSWTAAPSRRGRVAHRVTRAWAEQLRDAFGRVDAQPEPLRDLLSAAVKRSYKDCIGGMQRPTMRVARPDWAHTIIDLWRATVYRRILAVHATQGVWPVRVMTDSLAYADCVPEPQPRHHTAPFDTLTDALNVTSCGVGCGCAPAKRGALGGYKHEATTSSAEWVAAHKPRRRQELAA